MNTVNYFQNGGRYTGEEIEKTVDELLRRKIGEDYYTALGKVDPNSQWWEAAASVYTNPKYANLQKIIGNKIVHALEQNPVWNEDTNTDNEAAKMQLALFRDFFSGKNYGESKDLRYAIKDTKYDARDDLNSYEEFFKDSERIYKILKTAAGKVPDKELDERRRLVDIYYAYDTPAETRKQIALKLLPFLASTYYMGRERLADSDFSKEDNLTYRLYRDWNDQKNYYTTLENSRLFGKSAFLRSYADTLWEKARYSKDKQERKAAINALAILASTNHFLTHSAKKQTGGKIDEQQKQIVALVQAAMQGDEKAASTIQQIQEAAQKGDQKARAVMQMIQQVAQQIQKSARRQKIGGKMSYVHFLNTGTTNLDANVSFERWGGRLIRR